MKNTIVIKYTPVFEANLAAYNSKKYRVIANQGSTRSSKSYSLAQLLIKICLEEKKHISVVSPSLPHLKRGARKDFLDILHNMGIYSDADFNKTDNIYKFPHTGSIVEFFGADETNKLRGPGRDILFINEANLLPFEAYYQLSWRTKEVIFIDFNPADEYNWVYDVADKEGNKLIHSTYRNNKGNLTSQQIADIESLQQADENLWKVYGLGLRGSSSETIFTHYKIVDSFPVCEDIWFGLDFGFTHPAGFVKCGRVDGKIYVEELIYESGLTNSDLAYLIKTMHGVGKLSPIYCDTARPESIEEIKRMGLNAKAAIKDVWEGIQFIKSKELFITKNSTNLLKELRNYKWKVDKDGKTTNKEEPVKFMDDAIDAMRYGIYTHLFKKKMIYASANYDTPLR